ncbi:methyltransferase [Thermodesulfobacteriota bacterium]
MAKNGKTNIRAFGVSVLLSRHPKVRKIKRLNAPSIHGNKNWASSWLLMDYFERRGVPKEARVMDVGCGWGLPGIYCAKRHGARVTGVDIDSHVFPYLRLHADINKVEIAALHKGFNELKRCHLKDVDVMIGTDICFWDTMVDPLKRLILRALRSGVQLVVIADPGRPTFEKIGEYFVSKRKAKLDNKTPATHSRKTSQNLPLPSLSLNLRAFLSPVRAVKLFSYRYGRDGWFR